MGHTPDLQEDTFVAPGASVIGQVTAAVAVSIWYGAVLRGDVQPIHIGSRTNIQDGAVVHATTGRTPVTVGEDCTIGHRAILHGCTLGNRILIGMGAILLDEVEIGDDCLIGAGALILEGTVIPPGSLVVGSPARVRRPLSAAERTALLASAAHYVEAARQHRESLATLPRP
ncbi:MAG: gamma carbonic anhydrase family protein [Deltaproteobacteria bacterium]|nr:MAG: gamma carbonic anhydrase family protein [Deltaproteobacteria bacterium]